MTSYVLDLMKKLRRNKVVNLSNEEKVKALSEKAVGLLDHMKKTHDELGVINEELQQVIHDDEARIEKEIERHQRELKRLDENRVRASEEMIMNEKVQGELAKFIR